MAAAFSWCQRFLHCSAGANRVILCAHSDRGGAERSAELYTLDIKLTFFAERTHERHTLMFAFGIPVLVAALSPSPTDTAAFALHSPVRVAACEVSAPPADLNIGTDGAPAAPGGSALRVRFSNEGTQPIKRVVFALNDGSTIVDAGTFTPGVTIDHEFNIAGDEANSCSVASVTYADGTQWKG